LINTYDAAPASIPNNRNLSTFCFFGMIIGKSDLAESTAARKWTFTTAPPETAKQKSEARRRKGPRPAPGTGKKDDSCPVATNDIIKFGFVLYLLAQFH